MSEDSKIELTPRNLAKEIRKRQWSREEKLREENIRDSLTGIHNRGFWDRTINSLRPENNFTVMIIDIDDFKLTNDSFGHPAGDKVLIGTARTINDHVKLIGFNGIKRDIVARYGGEEFAILMPDLADPEVAQKRAEEIREAVSKLVINHHGTKISKTISVGVAVHQKGDLPEQTVIKADKALYEAKRIGKNKVVLTHV